MMLFCCPIQTAIGVWGIHENKFYSKDSIGITNKNPSLFPPFDKVEQIPPVDNLIDDFF